MKYAYTLLGLLIGLNAIGQSSSLLWKIEGKNLKKPSYIFGTIHLIPAKDYFEPAGLQAAFDQSEILVGEMDLSDLGSMSAELMAGMQMKGDTTLDMLLSTEDYHKLDEKMTASLGMGLDFMKTFKPFVISTMLISDLKQEESKSYEMELLAKANQKSMPMAGLETLNEQMSFLDALPYSYQAKELVKMMNQDSDDGYFQKMVDAYKTQNLDVLVKLINEQSESGEMQDILLDNRNKNWIPKIIKFAEEKPSFIAVGAGHLGGPNGIISLLKQAGYRLSPVLK